MYRPFVRGDIMARGPKGKPEDIAEYRAERKKLLANIRTAEKSGAEVDRSYVPDIPKRITKASIRKIKKANERENRYKHETWYGVGGKKLSGSKFRNLSKKLRDTFLGKETPELTYIDAVTALVDEAVRVIMAHENPNHLTDGDAQVLHDTWYSSLALAKVSDDGIFQLEDYCQMWQAQIAGALEQSIYGSGGAEGSSAQYRIESHFDEAIELLEWEPL